MNMLIFKIGSFILGVIMILTCLLIESKTNERDIDLGVGLLLGLMYFVAFILLAIPFSI